MPTTPLSSALVTNLKSATAWRFNSTLGPIFTPRFFCCTNPNSLGLSDGKEPVAIIGLAPNPALTGETVSYDGTDSYDPDGSITGYAWTFEGHTPTSGTASAGTLNYATAGTYTIQLTVTDGTSLQSLPAREELVVIEPTPPADGLYMATSNGVYYASGTAGSVAWEDKNSGLAGDQLEAHAVAIDPATQMLDEGNKVIWRANKGSIMVSIDGGATWADKTPGSMTNTWSDTTATAGTAQASIATGNDDGYVSGGAINTAGNAVLGGDTGAFGDTFDAWLRFETDIPQGGTAGTAYLTLIPDTGTAGTVCRLIIYGEDDDSPAAPSSAADYSGRVRTTGSAAWEPAAWTAGTAVQSPDLTTIIDELMARSGFGGTVQLFVQDDSSDSGVYRSWTSYNGTPADAAELYVEYTYPAAPTPDLLTFRDLLFVDDRLFALGTWQNDGGDWRSWLFYTDNAPDVRADGTAGSVSWSEV